ncbi:polymeric immunoglobulin receptor-like [Cetorhinus maximus]
MGLLFLNMKSIEFTIVLVTLSLSGSHGVVGPGEVNGKLGGSITINCRYSVPSKRNYEKYWCKGEQRFSCAVIAGTLRTQQDRLNSLVIVDNQTSGMFSVTMKQLSLEDAGWYWCGITMLGKDEMTSVKLNVLEAGLPGLKQVNGTLGEPVTLNCNYQVSYYKHHEKYLCKGSERKSCIVIATTQKHNANSGERIIPMDNQTSGVFSVTMTELSTEDEGLYWCGIDIIGYDSMIPLQLNVLAPLTTTILPNELQKIITLENESTSNFSIVLVVPVLGVLIVLILVATIYVARCRKKTAAGEKGSTHTKEEPNPVYNDLPFRDEDQDIRYDMETSKCSFQTADFPACIYGKQQHERKEPIQHRDPTDSSTAQLKKTMSGHSSFTHQKQARTMELIALLILISGSSLCQLTGPKRVHGELGGSVTVNCQYDLKYKDHVKQWCKGNYSIIYGCSAVVSTEEPEKGRVSLADNETQGIFSVTMDHLTKSDEGQYWCVIVRSTFKFDEKASIELEVSEGLQQLNGPKKVCGELGGSVTVKCQYDLMYKDHVKQWCKGSYSYGFGCSAVVSTEEPKKGRVSLADNKTQGIFSVTMDHLTKSDEGQYWCVIERLTFQVNERVSIKLEVSEDPPWSSTKGPTTSKARNTKTSVTTALTTTSTSDFRNPELWHQILPAIMVLIILLLVAAVILYVKLKRQKKRGMNEQSFTGMENPAEACEFFKEDNEVTYSKVKIAPRADLEKTYCNIQDLKAGRTAEGQDSSETVEYATVNFKS